MDAPTLVSARRTMYTMVGGGYDNPVVVPGQPFGLCEFGHQGLPHEEEIDNGRLIQNRHRVLHAGLGRFIQRDPLGYVDGMSLYQYVRSNPLNGMDAYGLCKENDLIDDIVEGVGGVVGTVWNAPNTVLGLAWGAVGLLLGGDVQLGENAVQFVDHPLMDGAITLGNTESYGGGLPNPDVPTRSASRQIVYPVGEHEIQHTYQGEMLGPAYLPANLIGGTLSLLGKEGGWHGPENFMETGPQMETPVPFPGMQPRK